MFEYLPESGNYTQFSVGVATATSGFLDYMARIPVGLCTVTKQRRVIGYIGFTQELVVMGCTPAVSDIKRGQELEMYVGERERFVGALSQLPRKPLGDAIVAKRSTAALVPESQGVVYTLDSIREAIIARLHH